MTKHTIDQQDTDLGVEVLLARDIIIKERYAPSAVITLSFIRLSVLLFEPDVHCTSVRFPAQQK